jgi:hypothetical protein
VPRDDHVWLRRRGHTRIVDDDDWGFVGNDKDQGLRFYLLRVRHRLGADIRLTPCARDSSRPTMYYHYGSVGGTKPDALLQRWRQYAARTQCDRAPLVPHLADNGFVLRRTIGWARRTRAEVRALREARRDTRRKAPPSDADGPLQLCATALDEGLKCVAESGARRAITVSLPDADCYSLHQHELCHTHRCGGAAARCSRRRPRFHAAIAAAHTARRRQQGGGRRTPRCRATLPLAERPRRGEHSVTEKEARCRSVVILMVSRLILCQVTCNLCIRNVYYVYKRVSINVTFYAGFDVSDHI